ncbi:MAG TPA: hypothetical protein VEG38_16220 [Acidimicrobiia bacterium]|nr:hypothetical protein [Acidimicrobiia bacterium]
MAVPDWADPNADDQPKSVEQMADELDAKTEELEEMTNKVDTEKPTVDPH